MSPRFLLVFSLKRNKQTKATCEALIVAYIALIFNRRRVPMAPDRQ